MRECYNYKILIFIFSCSTEEGRELAEKEGVAFIETSALNCGNVDEAFIELVKSMNISTDFYSSDL